MVNKSAGNQRGQAYHLAILKKGYFLLITHFTLVQKLFLFAKTLS